MQRDLPENACKFMIKNLNLGPTTYTGQLPSTDIVTGPSGVTIDGVRLAWHTPPGWTGNSSQPVNCTISDHSSKCLNHVLAMNDDRRTDPATIELRRPDSTSLIPVVKIVLATSTSASSAEPTLQTSLKSLLKNPAPSARIGQLPIR